MRSLKNLLSRVQKLKCYELTEHYDKITSKTVSPFAMSFVKICKTALTKAFNV